MSDQTSESSQEEGKKKNSDRAKHSRDQELADVRAIMATPAGRRFVWRYMSQLFVSSAHNSGSWTYFNEGERNVALKINADIVEAGCVDIFADMMRKKDS